MNISAEELFGTTRKDPVENLLDFIDHVERDTTSSADEEREKTEDDLSSDPDIIIIDDIPYTKVGTGNMNLVEIDQVNMSDNKIDEKIIDLIKDDTFLTNKHGNIEIDGPLFICKSDQCPDLLTKFEDYLRVLEEKIRLFHSENNQYRTRRAAIALYKPFHTYRRLGGIYFIVEEMVGWVREIHRITNVDYEYGKPSIEQIYYIVKECVFYHEMYHHKIEAFATKLELIFRQRFYTTGFECFYCKTSNSDWWLEEAFANVFAFYKTIKKLGNRPGFNRNYLKKIMREAMFSNQPLGYSLAYELTARNEQDADYFENRFLEVLWRYAYWYNNRTEIPALPEGFWNLFTYAHDPIINTINNVTYLVDASNPQGRKVRDFMMG